jgi:hypothetical protein
MQHYFNTCCIRVTRGWDLPSISIFSSSTRSSSLYVLLYCSLLRSATMKLVLICSPRAGDLGGQHETPIRENEGAGRTSFDPGDPSALLWFKFKFQLLELASKRMGEDGLSHSIFLRSFKIYCVYICSNRRKSVVGGKKSFSACPAS